MRTDKKREFKTDSRQRVTSYQEVTLGTKILFFSLVALAVWGTIHGYLGYAVFITTVASFFGLIFKLLSQSKKALFKEFEPSLNIAQKTFTSLPFSSLLCFTSLIIFLNNSSLYIDTQGVKNLAIARVYRDSSLEPVKEFQNLPGTAQHLTLPITWKGEWYRLEFDGYYPIRVHLTPLVRKRMVLAHELRVEPSILILPSLESLASLEDGASLCVWREKPLPMLLAAKGSKSRSSFLLGPQRPIPQMKVASWQNRLQVNFGESQVVHSLVGAWAHPKPLNRLLKSIKGATLRAAVISPTGVIISESKSVVVDDSRFIEMELIFQESFIDAQESSTIFDGCGIKPPSNYRR